MTHAEKLRLLTDEAYPLSAKYDPEWIYENSMGCQCLWLAESLAQIMTLRPGMRVLDLGCGNALTSVFLAKEFGVTVFAADLWVNATENWSRICAAQVQDKVFPIHAEVHSLPFADNFFDAIVCINSFQFYGNSEFFLGEYLAPLLRNNGEFGLAFFGPDKEFYGKVPQCMQANFWPDFHYFHSLSWMRRHFEQTRLFSAAQGDDLNGDGRRVMEKWAKIMEKPFMEDRGIMRWNRMTAKRNEYCAEDFRL